MIVLVCRAPDAGAGAVVKLGADDGCVEPVIEKPPNLRAVADAPGISEDGPDLLRRRKVR